MAKLPCFFAISTPHYRLKTRMPSTRQEYESLPRCLPEAHARRVPMSDRWCAHAAGVRNARRRKSKVSVREARRANCKVYCPMAVSFYRAWLFGVQWCFVGRGNVFIGMASCWGATIVYNIVENFTWSERFSFSRTKMIPRVWVKKDPRFVFITYLHMY